MKIKRFWISLTLFIFMVIPLTGYTMSSMKLNNHNLSVSGPGKIKSSTESRICIFCHITHTGRMGFAAGAPLWNRSDSNTLYTTYSSSTINYTPSQPTGSSRLCLSCHDGTIALGDTFRKPVSDMRSRFIDESSKGYVGIDLSDEHPVSLPYTSTQRRNQKLAHPSQFRKVKLENDQLQCISCHDVHDNTYGNFLIESDLESALCLECHDEPGWNDGIHSRSLKSWNGKGKNPWADSKYQTVRGNGCKNCHSVHRAPGRARLLKSRNEDEICLTCHDGGTGSDIKRLVDPKVKMFTHSSGMDDDETHDPTENYEGVVKRHVKCVDCHNSHQANSDKTHLAPHVNGTTRGVKGINSNGKSTSSAGYLYEVCYKCHGNEHNNVAPTSSMHKRREYDSWNTREEFSPSNPSYHPVEGGKRNSSPSLKPGITSKTANIYCHDCHNNDDTDKNKLSGPHGSNKEWMLEKNYVVYDPNPYSPSDYDLCFKCHVERSILNDTSFPLHRKHVVEESTPCAVCHDPHGVGRKMRGDSTHLINFDLDAVTHSGGLLYFKDNGLFSGSCVLVCHGVDHNTGPGGQPNFSYSN